MATTLSVGLMSKLLALFHTEEWALKRSWLPAIVDLQELIDKTHPLRIPIRLGGEYWMDDEAFTSFAKAIGPHLGARGATPRHVAILFMLIRATQPFSRQAEIATQLFELMRMLPSDYYPRVRFNLEKGDTYFA